MTNLRRQVTILMADDDAEDRMLAKEALEEDRLVNDLRFVEDGDELMDYLYHRGKCEVPNLVQQPNAATPPKGAQ